MWRHFGERLQCAFPLATTNRSLPTFSLTPLLPLHSAHSPATLLILLDTRNMPGTPGTPSLLSFALPLRLNSLAHQTSESPWPLGDAC
jgi:hypothetical protein